MLDAAPNVSMSQRVFGRQPRQCLQNAPFASSNWTTSFCCVFEYVVGGGFIRQREGNKDDRLRAGMKVVQS